MSHNETAEDCEQTSTDGVRRVPNRHLRSQLLRWNPMREQTCARRESAALEDVVEYQQYTERNDERVRCYANLDAEQCRCKAKCKRCCRAEQQTERHMVASVHSIGEQTICETRQTIYQADNGEDDTETRIRDSVFGCQTRHCERKVFAHEVEQRIPEHCRNDCAPLPIFERFIHLHLPCVNVLREASVITLCGSRR